MSHTADQAEYDIALSIHFPSSKLFSKSKLVAKSLSVILLRGERICTNSKQEAIDLERLNIGTCKLTIERQLDEADKVGVKA